jgi:hypothetical protein
MAAINMKGEVVQFLEESDDIWECIEGEAGKRYARFKNQNSGIVVTYFKEVILDMESIVMLNRSHLVPFMCRG